MKRREISVRGYKNIQGVYRIILENIRFHENCFYIIEKIIKHFTDSSEMFFGFCRTDGVKLTPEQYEKYQKEIWDFFKSHGEIKQLNEYLWVAKAKMDNESYKMLSCVFDYYLDTVLFVPQMEWDFFTQYHYEYMNHSNEDYVVGGFTQVVFSYFDSGDFSVCFNSQKYDSLAVLNLINEIVFDEYC